MSLTRSQLARSVANVTYGGATLFMRDDIKSVFDPTFDDVLTSDLGRIDEIVKARPMKLSLMLWGGWENLPILFPGYITSPVIGASIFGDADAPLVVQARNGRRITYPNAQITRLLDLQLGVDAEIFAAALEVTALIADGANPEDAGAYYTLGSGVYDASAFTRGNYNRQRWTAAWGAVPGFTSFPAQKGFRIGWAFDTVPLAVDGYDVRDLTVGPKGLIATCTAIPIGPTMDEVRAAALSDGTALGALVHARAADLVLTGGVNSVTLSNSFLAKHEYHHGAGPLQVNECAFRTTRGIAAGALTAVAAVA